MKLNSQMYRYTQKVISLYEVNKHLNSKYWHSAEMIPGTAYIVQELSPHIY